MNISDYAQKVIKTDGTAYPGNSVVEYINKPAFNRAKGDELDYTLDVEKASFLMLYNQGILSHDDAPALASALLDFPYDDIRNMEFDRDYAEDMFFAVEKKLSEIAGPNASNLHLGRSRNDMLRTVNKMLIRDQMMDLYYQLNQLIAVLIELAKAHLQTIMPAYTHTQSAQPTTFAHYLSAVVNVLLRDAGRMKAAIENIQLCPMGAGALTTTSFPIDRSMLCEYLGFDKVMLNSYDAVCSSDFLTESAAALGVLLGDTGRFVMHLRVWSAEEYGFLQQSGAYIGISSMMPQKRNPTTLEHIRAGISESLGKCFTVQLTNHNCEFEGNIDIVDSPVLLCETFEQARKNLFLLTNICATLKLDKELLKQRVFSSFTVMTDFADYLVQKEKIDYRTAHGVASRLVDQCLKEGVSLQDITPGMIQGAYRFVTGREMTGLGGDLAKAMNAAASIKTHCIEGGPNPERVTEMLDMAEKQMNEYHVWADNLSKKIHGTREKMNNKIRECIL